jgi:hypothetical protein
VQKDTSELDFIVPLIWRIKKDNRSANISVLYGVINKKMILRKSTFYSDFFSKHKIKEYDLGDFMFKSLPSLRNYLKRKFSFSYWDGVSKTGLQGVIKKGFKRIIKCIDHIMISLPDYEDIFSSFQPDIIFFALRSYRTPMKQKFFNHTYRAAKPVVLYPQGAFASTGSYEVSYGKRKNAGNRALPEFCEVWYSFSKEITSERYPLSKDQFHYVGYPGLDREWLDSLSPIYDGNAKRRLRCLFIIRKFVRNNRDDWVFDYEEFMQIARATIDSLRKTGIEITLVVKPHPSNDFKEVEDVLSLLEYDDFEITYESIYQVIAQCDFVISISSTVMLIPVIYGLPVIFLNSSVKETFERWKPMKDLFSNLQFYVEDLKDLDDMVNKVVSALRNGISLENLTKKDIQHFREFFPDGSLDLCMKHLNSL